MHERLPVTTRDAACVQQAVHYWDQAEASDVAVMGGYEHLLPIDIDGSRTFMLRVGEARGAWTSCSGVVPACLGTSRVRAGMWAGAELRWLKRGHASSCDQHVCVQCRCWHRCSMKQRQAGGS